jgi:hypothetical protein
LLVTKVERKLVQVLALPMIEKDAPALVIDRPGAELLDEHRNRSVEALTDDAARVTEPERADFVAAAAFAADDDPIQARVIGVVGGRAVAIEDPRLAGGDVVSDRVTLDYKIVVPSRKRPHNMPVITGLLPTSLICIDEREEADYAPFVPKERLLLHPLWKGARTFAIG